MAAKFPIYTEVYAGRPPNFNCKMGDVYYEGKIVKILPAARRKPVQYMIKFTKPHKESGNTDPVLVPQSRRDRAIVFEKPGCEDAMAINSIESTPNDIDTVPPTPIAPVIKDTTTLPATTSPTPVAPETPLLPQNKDMTTPGLDERPVTAATSKSSARWSLVYKMVSLRQDNKEEDIAGVCSRSTIILLRCMHTQ